MNPTATNGAFVTHPLGQASINVMKTPFGEMVCLTWLLSESTSEPEAMSLPKELFDRLVYHYTAR